MKNMHLRDATDEKEKDFHKTRIAFFMIDGRVQFLKDSTMSHYEWAKSLGITDEAVFTKLIRGQCLHNRAIFYKGNFVYDDDVIAAAKKHINTIKAFCGFKQMEVWCGVTVGKVGELWPPQYFVGIL